MAAAPLGILSEFQYWRRGLRRGWRFVLFQLNRSFFNRKTVSFLEAPPSRLLFTSNWPELSAKPSLQGTLGNCVKFCQSKPNQGIVNKEKGQRARDTVTSCVCPCRYYYSYFPMRRLRFREVIYFASVTQLIGRYQRMKLDVFGVSKLVCFPASLGGNRGK